MFVTINPLPDKIRDFAFNGQIEHLVSQGRSVTSSKEERIFNFGSKQKHNTDSIRLVKLKFNNLYRCETHIT